MLTGLGKPAAPADAVGLLLECHGRIRTFLALALRISDAPAAATGEVAEAAGQVHRYFAQALPLHAEDEDRSLLPRLRGKDPAVDRALADMEREHREHGPALSALLDACQALVLRPAAHAELAPALRRAAEALERHFQVHLDREEAVIFPAVRRLLLPAEDAAVMGEMRERRGGR